MGDIILSLYLALFSGAVGATTSSLSLGLRNSQYISHSTDYYRKDASSENASIAVDLVGEHRFRKGWRGIYNLTDEYSTTEEWNYLTVRDLSLAHVSGDVTWKIGRSRADWSSWDKEWKQGVFQPRHMHNALRPEVVGLTGVFVETKRTGWNWSAGALAVNMPDMSPRFWVEDSRLVSRNPWFDPPASTFLYRGREGDIRYAIDKPEAQDIVLRPGAIARLGYQTERVNAGFTVARKPMPQLQVGFPSRDRIVVSPESDYLDVEVSARAVDHDVINLESTWAIGDLRVGGALAYEQPVGQAAPEGWMMQQFAPAWIWSAHAEMWRWRASFLKVGGGAARDKGEFASDKSLFQRRYQYDEAYALGFVQPVRRIFGQMIEAEARVTFDRLQNGGVLSLGAAMLESKQWRVHAEVDLIGLVGEDAEVEDGFLSKFRANDRVGMGMSYVY